jgi:hypothetical protein
MKNFKNLLFVAVLFISATVLGQTKLTGTVVDESNEPLPGASVVVKGTTNGTSTDFDGKFMLDSKTTSGTLIISFIGYESIEVNFTSAGDLGTIQLKEGGNLLEEIVLVGKGVIDLAGGRKTPVAVNTIKAAEIQAKIGAQDVTMTLVNTPSVYVAGQSGGFGDSRINVRGFDQTNTAYLLNGQPINGMEDGRMYWSNWSGINDVASAVQIQRGLGASKLAISSVGGTVNFVTKATDRREGGYASVTTANNSYFKSTFSYSTGMNEKGFGASVMLSTWQGDGYNMGNKGQGQTYFISLGYKANERHNFNFLLTGAPQWHDQNFSKSISTYLQYGRQYNDNWGTYKGQYMTERRNFYHKPVFNFNWDWDIDEDTQLSTVLYGSFGRGGGTGNRGNRIRTSTGQIDYDAIYAFNEGVAGGAGGFFAAGRGYVTRASMNLHNWFGVVSNFNKKLSENLTFNVGMDLRTYYGKHFRVVENFHGLTSWQENIRLKDHTNNHQNLGSFGTYKRVIATRSWNADPYTATWASIDDDQKIAYNNEERISYGGIFTQLEYSNEDFSAFIQGALNNQWYQRFDLYQYADASLIAGTSSQGTGTPLPGNITPGTDSEKVSEFGYNLKGGVSYSVNESNSVYFNTGLYSRQPFFDNLFPDFTNQRSPLTSNEKIFGLEAGYSFKGEKFSGSVNVYRTRWSDRVESSSNVVGGVVLNTLNFGLEQLHQGIEIDAIYKATKNLRIKGNVSFGDWKYVGSTITRVQDEDQNIQSETSQDVDGGEVGDAPQTSFFIGADYRVNRNLSIDFDYRHYDRLFADVGAVKKNLELPSYGIADFGVSYKMFVGKEKNDNLNFRFNINNLFHKIYLSDLRTYIFSGDSNANGTTYQGIDTANQGYFGWGRTWNVSLRYNF